MPITVGDPTVPTQSPLTSGVKPGFDVKAIIASLADSLGYQPENARFKGAMIRVINETLMEIQLADPLLRRTLVLGAAFSLTAGNDTYDVRSAGFGWTNCFAVMRLQIPNQYDRTIEIVTPEIYRNRGILAGESGPPVYAVRIDQFRIRFVPPPDQGFSGNGDYQQDIPALNDDDDRVDWPRAWDIVLLEGARYRGYKWRNEQDGVWQRQYTVYKDLLGELKSTERVTTRVPTKAVTLRARRGPIIPHDNSVDVRWRRR